MLPVSLGGRRHGRVPGVLPVRVDSLVEGFDFMPLPRRAGGSDAAGILMFLFLIMKEFHGLAGTCEHVGVHDDWPPRCEAGTLAGSD